MLGFALMHSGWVSETKKRLRAICSEPLSNCCLGALDFDVDAAWQVESHQGVDRLVGRFDDVDQSVVGSQFEVLHRLLVDVRSSNNAEASDVGWKWNRSLHARAGALGGVNDLFCGLLDDAVVKCSKSNSYFHSALMYQFCCE